MVCKLFVNNDMRYVGCYLVDDKTRKLTEMAYFPEDRPLPKRLKKEPLIQAVFEMRFSGIVPASEIFPGFLFGKREDKNDKTLIENLPAAQVPKQLRDMDPNLQFVPVIRLIWKKYIISISDRSVVIGCDYPYPGWDKFKPIIIEIIGHLKESGIVASVSRYSMKYVDLIESADIAHQISLIDMKVSVAGQELKNQNFHIRIEFPVKDFINVVQIVPAASANLSNGEKREGVIIDVDTIYNINDQKIEDVINDGFDGGLEIIHKINKRMFFSCLTEETIKSLEPCL